MARRTEPGIPGREPIHNACPGHIRRAQRNLPNRPGHASAAAVVVTAEKALDHLPGSTGVGEGTDFTRAMGVAPCDPVGHGEHLAEQQFVASLASDDRRRHLDRVARNVAKQRPVARGIRPRLRFIPFWERGHQRQKLLAWQPAHRYPSSAFHVVNEPSLVARGESAAVG